MWVGLDVGKEASRPRSPVAAPVLRPSLLLFSMLELRRSLPDSGAGLHALDQSPKPSRQLRLGDAQLPLRGHRVSVMEVGGQPFQLAAESSESAPLSSRSESR